VVVLDFHNFLVGALREVPLRNNQDKRSPFNHFPKRDRTTTHITKDFTMSKPHQIYLDSSPTLPNQLITSADLRCTFTDTIKTLLQQTNHTLVPSSEPNLNLEIFLNSLKTHPKVYQACMSRQFAADLPPDIEQTALQDEPKDWFIKTADFGDTHDRVLQHRDGEYSKFLEDIARYHHIFQQTGCDRLVTFQPAEYSSYKPQVAAAMQCLGYASEQFHFIPVQPLKLYAFHTESNEIQPIPDLPLDELQKAVNLETLRWYSLRVPFDQTATLNLSTSNPEHPENYFYRIQLTYAYTQKYLTLLQNLNFDGSDSASVVAAENSTEQQIEQTLDRTQAICDRAMEEIAPHLICQHVEQIAEQTLNWLPSPQWQSSSYQTLQRVQNTLFDLVEVKLGFALIPTANATPAC
jgi:hypothetical protein